MEPMDDSVLLREYSENHSDEAFTGLVARHVNLVYSVAMRHTGNAHQAEEITQAVFIILSKKAAQLRHDKALSSWLFQTTRLTANNFLRSENRRHHREQEAYMQSVPDESGRDEMWQQTSPLLDNAVGGLAEIDRRAIVLRFYEDRNLREVGAALGANEETAKKRVTRALEKLRKIFAKHGVVSTTAIIGGLMSANSVQAAPAGLATTIAATTVKGSVVAASILTLAKGTMKTMTWLKIKFAVGVGAIVLLAGGVVTIAISQTNEGSGQSTAQDIVKKSQDAYAALSSYSDSGIIIDNIGSQTLKTTFDIRLQRPNFYRIDWSQTTEYFTSGGAAWSSGNGDFLEMKHGSYNARPQRYKDMETVLASATGVSGQASATIPGTFFKQNWGDVLHPKDATLQRQEDQAVHGIDCYVISSSTGPTTSPDGSTIQKVTTTLWIGRRDFLIHQTQLVMDGASMKIPPMSDARIKNMLRQQNQPITPETIAAQRKILDTANEQAQSMMASGKFMFTQTHENISVNQTFSAADFENVP
jgi:RNA polymerase sigma factor (sigma-70 family)